MYLVETARGRILIVDDEPDILEVLSERLIEAGYDVHPVQASVDAVDAAVAFSPDVILLDLVMPRMMGDAVLEALRSAGVRAPIIAMSGRSTRPRAGFFAVVGKPFDMQQLRRVLADAISRRPDA
jgi:two-component system OmpR family response regulator